MNGKMSTETAATLEPGRAGEKGAVHAPGLLGQMIGGIAAAPDVVTPATAVARHAFGPNDEIAQGPGYDSAAETGAALKTAITVTGGNAAARALASTTAIEAATVTERRIRRRRKASRIGPVPARPLQTRRGRLRVSAIRTWRRGSKLKSRSASRKLRPILPPKRRRERRACQFRALTTAVLGIGLRI